MSLAYEACSQAGVINGQMKTLMQEQSENIGEEYGICKIL